MANFKKTIEDLLGSSDIQVNGSRPWDIQIYNDNFYCRVLSNGVLGLGESYMDGWWDCEAVDQFTAKILEARLDIKVKESGLALFLIILKANFLNFQSKKRAYIVGTEHYDLGNDLFSLMLDKSMSYSCGYWRNAHNLEQAQEDKLDLICRKMKLEKGMSILEIGCGWGGFAKYAAENYGVSVRGITISKEQKDFADNLCKGLDVTFDLKDYRSLNSKYDRIVSIGMFEHVGYKNYKKYMNVANRCLKDDGLFLLHTIGGNISCKTTNAWTNKYIFPNGMIPSAKQINTAIEGVFQIEDWHSFGQYYDSTLMAWYDNFQNNLLELSDKYNEKFQRMWSYYLLTCAAAFRVRKIQLWQIVLVKNGVKGGFFYKNDPRFQ